MNPNVNNHPQVASEPAPTISDFDALLLFPRLVWHRNTHVHGIQEYCEYLTACAPTSKGDLYISLYHIHKTDYNECCHLRISFEGAEDLGLPAWVMLRDPNGWYFDRVYKHSIADVLATNDRVLHNTLDILRTEVLNYKSVEPPQMPAQTAAPVQPQVVRHTGAVPPSPQLPYTPLTPREMHENGTVAPVQAPCVAEAFAYPNSK